MDEHINNGNTTENTDKQPYNNYDYSDEEYERMRIEMEKRRAERRAREHRRVMKNRIIAIAILLVIIFVIVKACGGKSDNKPAADSSSQTESTKQAEEKTTTKKKTSDNSKAEETKHKIEQSNGMTFVDGILIVNKTYSLPSDYAPGVSTIAQNAFDEMAAAAAQDGITLFVNSSYRSYQDQESLYNSYAAERGTEAADEVSSRPGHSEHQTGLTFDVNTTEDSFAGTPEANWLAEHCAEYGFIIRYPEGKEDKTGYLAVGDGVLDVPYDKVKNSGQPLSRGCPLCVCISIDNHNLCCPDNSRLCSRPPDLIVCRNCSGLNSSDLRHICNQR